MCVATTPSSVSEARLRANRANAQRSTGPKTAEGKSRSARNATTHALTASLPQTIVPEDEKQEYEAFSSTFLQALNPQGPLELLLCQRLLLRAYQLQRCHSAESHLLQSQRQKHTDAAKAEYDKEYDLYQWRLRTCKKHPPTPPAPPTPPPTSAELLAQSFHKDSSPITRLQRYATTADLAFHRDLKQLLTLQKLRASQPTPDPADDPALPNEANSNRSTAVPAVLTTPNHEQPSPPNQPTEIARDAGVSPAQPLTHPQLQNEPNTPDPLPPPPPVSSAPSVAHPSPHSAIRIPQSEIPPPSKNFPPTSDILPNGTADPTPRCTE